MRRRWPGFTAIGRCWAFCGATPKRSRPIAKRWPILRLDTISQPGGPASRYFFQGWAKWSDGNEEPRLAEMRRGIAILREQGMFWHLPSLEAALAEAEASAGETDAGLRRLEDALAELERTEVRWCEAEMHRIRAEILLKRKPANTAAPEQSLQAAIAIAQSQKARSFELRAALSLAKLY